MSDTLFGALCSFRDNYTEQNGAMRTFPNLYKRVQQLMTVFRTYPKITEVFYCRYQLNETPSRPN
jgi:hypothetical protein